MRVQINQPRADNESRGLKPLNWRRRARREAGADRGDFAVHNKNIRHGIKAIGGINHASPGQEHRIHWGEDIRR